MKDPFTRRQVLQGILGTTVLLPLYPALEYGLRGTVSSSSARAGAISTGFAPIDHLLTGFRPAEVILVAGRPYMGKFCLLLNIAMNMACKKRISIGMFSPGHSKEQVARGLLLVASGVDPHRLYSGTLEETDWQKIVAASGVLNKAPIHIDDAAIHSIRDIRQEATRMKLDRDIGLMIVDGLNLLHADEMTMRPVREDRHAVTSALKELALELQIPILATVNLRRHVDYRPGCRPVMSDVDLCGYNEKDADVIIFLYGDMSMKHWGMIEDGDLEKIERMYCTHPKVNVDLMIRDSRGSFMCEKTSSVLFSPMIFGYV